MARFLSINLTLVGNTLRNGYLILVMFPFPSHFTTGCWDNNSSHALVLVRKQRRYGSRDVVNVEAERAKQRDGTVSGHTEAEASEKLPDTLKRQIYRKAL